MATRDAVQAGPNEVAIELVKRVLAAQDTAPIEEMERLIALAEDDPAFRAELLRGTVEVLDADPAGLVSCWLVLVAGELGAEAAGPLLAALGTSDGEALDATILPVLTRMAGPAYQAVAMAIQDSAPADSRYRADLYGVLAAAALADHDRHSLRDFALHRLEARIPREGADAETEAGALAALVHLVAPEALEISGPCPLEGRLAPLVRTLREGWRDTARDIERRFGAR